MLRVTPQVWHFQLSIVPEHNQAINNLPPNTNCSALRPPKNPWPMNRKELVQELDALQDKFKLQQKYLRNFFLVIKTGINCFSMFFCWRIFLHLLAIKKRPNRPSPRYGRSVQRDSGHPAGPAALRAAEERLAGRLPASRAERALEEITHGQAMWKKFQATLRNCDTQIKKENTFPPETLRNSRTYRHFQIHQLQIDHFLSPTGTSRSR